MKKTVGVILGCVVMGLGIVGLVINYYFFPLPKVDEISGILPTKFVVAAGNLFETQVHNECSAFSSAYVLRHFGEDETGLSLYEKFDYKLPISGYVLPNGILNYFEKIGFEITMYTGTLDLLKIRLTAGVPVIVLVGNGFSWQHYMTLVGYDDEVGELYFFDSLRENDENDSLPGNRTLTEDYFLSMWDNGLPIFKQLYFVIDK